MCHPEEHVTKDLQDSSLTLRMTQSGFAAALLLRSAKTPHPSLLRRDTFPSEGKALGAYIQRPPCVKGLSAVGRLGDCHVRGRNASTILPSRFAIHPPLHKEGFWFAYHSEGKALGAYIQRLLLEEKLRRRR